MKGPNAAKVNTAIGDGCVACVVVREEKNEAGGGFCSQSDSKKNWRFVVCVVVCMVVVVVGIVVVADANLPKRLTQLGWTDGGFIVVVAEVLRRASLSNKFFFKRFILKNINKLIKDIKNN